MEYLYVCHFSNGHIKVGRSIDPSSRIAQHADRVACVGINVANHFIVECVGPSHQAEFELIRECAVRAKKRNKSEWFEGLDYDVVVGLADVLAKKTHVAARKTIVDKRPSQSEIDASINSHNEWLKNCRYYFSNGRWVDKTPEQPHFPDSAIPRWETRPNDWHLIWPELESHPCSILFAKNHPKRTGSPKIEDWIASWPFGFKQQEDIPNLTAGLNCWDASGDKRKHLRPDDWHLIWPELIGADGAPEIQVKAA